MIQFEFLGSQCKAPSWMIGKLRYHIQRQISTVVELQRLLIPAKTTSPLGPLCTSQSLQLCRINSFKAHSRRKCTSYVGRQDWPCKVYILWTLHVQDLSEFGGDWVVFFGFLSYFNVFLLLFWIFTALHNAYFEQLKFLAVVCAQTMPKKSQKIYDGTYLFPSANNSEENREKSIFVSLKL